MVWLQRMPGKPVHQQVGPLRGGERLLVVAAIPFDDVGDMVRIVQNVNPIWNHDYPRMRAGFLYGFHRERSVSIIERPLR